LSDRKHRNAKGRYESERADEAASASMSSALQSRHAAFGHDQSRGARVRREGRAVAHSSSSRVPADPGADVHLHRVVRIVVADDDDGKSHQLARRLEGPGAMRH
jgi:hypothetical protein